MAFPHIYMKSNTQNGHLNLKLLFLGIFLAFLLFFVLTSNVATSALSPLTRNQVKQVQSTGDSSSTSACSPSTCNKIPPSLVEAILHYTTSNITPQQTLGEIKVTSNVLERKSPCKFLVFGLGHDSPMWSSLNFGGRTVFLEENKAWIDQVTSKFPSLESYHVRYDSKLSQADDLMKMSRDENCTMVDDTRFSKCKLALKGVPSDIFEVEWDLIMVDAPTGFITFAPGRMGAIYTAGMMARFRKEGETDVFVHDVDRTVEDEFSRAFLCEGYMKQQEGRLRHFTIPSHRGSDTKPFCPKGINE